MGKEGSNPKTIITIFIGFVFMYINGSSGKNYTVPEMIYATIVTNTSGSWNTGSVWTPGAIPGGADMVTVNHSLTLNANLNLSGGAYLFNQSVTDISGGTAYGLGMSSGSLTVNANTTFEGNGNISATAPATTSILVKSGSTLIIGTTYLSGSSTITIEQNATLIINGTLQTTNTVTITVHGTLQVNGNYSGSGSAKVTGSGSFYTTGTLSQTNTASSFGSTNNCTSGPCDGNNLCAHTNTIAASATTVCSNNAVSFTGTTNATLPSYTWYVSTISSNSGFTIAPGNNNISTYSSPTLYQTTWFKRVVTSGSCSEYAIIKVLVNPSTMITSQPADAAICAGSNAQFSAIANGTDLVYAWQVLAGNSWSNLVNNTVYNGVATSQLTLTTPDQSYQGKQYRCSISGTCAPLNILTNTVSLSFKVNASIITQPLNTAICDNATGNISVSAAGSSLTYTWQVSHSGLWSNLTASSVFSNIYGNTLFITNPSAALSGNQYRCLVGGACAASIPSNAITLTVNSSPSITTQPADGSSCASASVAFLVNAGGAGLNYQWQIYNTNVWQAVSASSPYSGNTTPSLNITAPSTALHHLQYRCVISGTCSSVTTNTVKLSVYSAGEWQGGTGEFTNASKWCGGIPSSTRDLIINSGSVTINAAGAQAKNVMIGSGGGLTIDGFHALSVFGNWSNQGTFNANNGRIDFAGTTSQTITGSNTFKNVIVDNAAGLSIVSGKQTINGYLTLSSGKLKTNQLLKIDFDNGGAIAGSGSGTIEDTIVVSRSITAGWHYLGGCFDHLSYGDLSNHVSLNNFYTYQESNPNSDMQQGWTNRTENQTTLLTGQKDVGGPAIMIGYALAFPASSLLELKGIYEHGKTYNTGLMSYTNSGNSETDGWQLISNPYPGYMNWNSTEIIRTGIASTIYYYNSVLGLNSQYTPASNGVPEVSINSGTGFIPPLQAFWIQTNTANASLSVNGAAIESPAVKPSFFRKGSTETMAIRMSVKNEYCEDESMLRFSSVASEDYDSDYDSRKLKNDGQCPSLYWHYNGNNYSLNTLPDLKLNERIPLHFEAFKSSIYTFQLKETLYLPTGISVILEDKTSGISYNLSQKGKFEFVYGTNDNVREFEVYFIREEITRNEAPAQNQFLILFSESGLHVKLEQQGEELVNVRMINMQGKVVFEENNVRISSESFSLNKENWEQGLYLISLETQSKSVVKKIVVQ